MIVIVSTRILSLFCAAMLLLLSPYAKYIDTLCIKNVHATGLEVPAALGAEAVIDFLIAFFASVAVEETYNNREAIAQAYSEYLEERAANMPAEGAYLQYFDPSTRAIKYVTLDVLINELKDYHDIAVDNLSDVYAKYCPALLKTFDDFMMDVLNRDIYVRGISENLVDFAPLTEADIEEQCSGTSFNYRWRTYFSSDYCDYSRETFLYIDDITYSGTSSYRMAGYYLTDTANTVNLDSGITAVQYNKDFRIAANSPRGYKDSPPGQAIHTRTLYGKVLRYNVASWVSSALWYDQKVIPGRFNGSFSATANFPIFIDELSALTYLRTGEGYENALNYRHSMYDTITDNVDLPPFNRQWQEELWARAAKAPDHGIGIGTYGRGVSSANWSDDLPWIGLDSLPKYTHSLFDIYQKVIDDVINGTYDSNKDIPETYSDAWERTIADSWVAAVEKAEELGDRESGKSDYGDEEKNQSTSWYNEDGSINYPPNNGAVAGTEQTISLQPGEVVGRYGEIGENSDFVTQSGADPDTLSLPPTTDSSTYQEFVVMKEINNVIQSEVAAWGESSGGGIQYQLPTTILKLIDSQYLQYKIIE